MTNLNNNNKYRLVKGELPKKREIVDWSEQKILSYLKFAEFFMELKEYKGKMTHMYFVDKERWSKAEQFDDPFWGEFIARININGGTYDSIKKRLMMSTRTVLSWIKDNGYIVNDEMMSIMKDNDRFNWAVNTFIDKKTKVGAEVVTLNNKETTDPIRSNANPTLTDTSSPQVIYNKSTLKLAQLMNNLLAGVKQRDLQKIKDPRERIKMALALHSSLSKSLKVNPGVSKVFNTLVINKATREDLEKASLDYIQAQQDEK